MVKKTKVNVSGLQWKIVNNILNKDKRTTKIIRTLQICLNVCELYLVVRSLAMLRKTKTAPVKLLDSNNFILRHRWNKTVQTNQLIQRVCSWNSAVYNDAYYY